MKTDWRPTCDMDGCQNIAMPKGVFCFRHRRGPQKTRRIPVPPPGTWPEPKTTTTDKPKTGGRKGR